MSTELELNLTSTTGLLFPGGIAIEQLGGGQMLLWDQKDVHPSLLEDSTRVMEQRNTPERWYRLRRLERAGVHLPHPPAQPNHPLRVEHVAPVMGYDVFPVVNGVGLGISVRITAGTCITIGGYRLSWGEIPASVAEIEPLAPCAACSTDRVPRYCFDVLSGHQCIPEPNLQKDKVWAGGTLTRGLWVRGCFSGLLPACHRFAALVVPATLYINDVLGNEYPYPLRLKVSPELKSCPMEANGAP